MSAEVSGNKEFSAQLARWLIDHGWIDEIGPDTVELVAHDVSVFMQERVTNSVISCINAYLAETWTTPSPQPLNHTPNARLCPICGTDLDKLGMYEDYVHLDPATKRPCIPPSASPKP